MLNLHAKNQLRLPLFLEILQRYCKLVIMGASGIPGYGQQKQWYQLHAKKQIYPLHSP